MLIHYSCCNAVFGKKNFKNRFIAKRDYHFYGDIRRDCYNRATLGSDYSGEISWTQYGKPCMFWNTYGRRGTNYFSYKHNYCRNPDRKPGGPWCYHDFNSWGYCDVPKCSNAKELYYRQHEKEKLYKKKIRYYTITEYITKPVYVPYTRSSMVTTTTTVTALSRSLVTVPVTARSTSLEVETMTKFRTEQSLKLITTTKTTTDYLDTFGDTIFPEIFTSSITTTASTTTIFITETSQTTFDLTVTRTVTNFETTTILTTSPVTSRSIITREIYRTIVNDDSDYFL
ncbi:Kremen protein 1 [Trichoplax sp. H2]|uniref:Kringle domain-containing protein n=1 Tax=Trichoplax adhaerens TaxID=10228 RepID=B3SBX2_TRIAD|nr:hypothetical protein TRIADDRAFT_61767 [Trichoplax adhaerens]EDV19707.1 hypothetical protein TRIADDRAFT_61767 [Trichoplax adhaerens]RDD38605.1 Kremen protein 1 [Trichoplax sp. H2]|eukprot:XP_002117731.1 hypothetical protein TRIADDRAFT_61767 [Trichoplax adhaerens]